MTKDEKFELELVAEAFMCARHTTADVIKQVVRKFSCDRKDVEAAMERVRKRWRQDVSAMREERRAQALMTLAVITRKAIDARKFGDAVKAEKLSAEIAGLLHHDEEVLPVAPVDAEHDEFSERSSADLQFFLDHDCWPEEYPDEPAETVH
jgi:hypothetical protein